MGNIRIGIFGLKRGSHYINEILANNGDIVAICDKSSWALNDAKERLGDTVAAYSNVEEFMEHPMDCVFLANYFHEHAKYAIYFLEKGVHVLSECTSNATMADGVALVRAAEKSNAIYMLAENYPYMLFNREMKRVCDGGSLGKIVYAEGEYNHPGKSNPDVDLWLSDSLKHWRLFLPRTYYITHSLGPIMYVTGAEPVRVSATPIFDPPSSDSIGRPAGSGDRAAIITCLNNDKSVFKLTASAAFGGSSNSYRFCGQKGTIENVRGTGGSEKAGTEGKVMLRYNSWQVPEGMEEVNFYQPELNDKDAELIKKSAHGGGDFIVMRTFFDCIRNNKKPDFDVYFATKMASVAILAHRSVLSGGMPFDVPDFRKEEDRVKYENDTDSPFWYSDGTAPTVRCSSDPDYKPSQAKIDYFTKLLRGERE